MLPRIVWLTGLVLVALLGAPASGLAATMFDLSSTPSSPVVSGGLEFSNFQFVSLKGDFEASDVTVSIEGTQVVLKASDGALTVSDGDKALFFVRYDVKALSAGVDGVSLLLDSETQGHKFAKVLAQKALLRHSFMKPPDHDHGWHHKHDKNCRHGDHEWGHRDSRDDRYAWGLDDWRERAEWDDRWHHGRDDHGDDDWDEHGDHGDLPAWIGSGRAWGNKHGKFGHDKKRRLLATLETFEIAKKKTSMATRLVEAGFPEQESFTVIDSVLLWARGHDDEATWISSTNEYQLVPEPHTAALLFLGLAGLGLGGRRRGKEADSRASGS